jgi:hypothetical protein
LEVVFGGCGLEVVVGGCGLEVSFGLPKETSEQNLKKVQLSAISGTSFD